MHVKNKLLDTENVKIFVLLTILEHSQYASPHWEQEVLQGEVRNVLSTVDPVSPWEVRDAVLVPFFRQHFQVW